MGYDAPMPASNPRITITLQPNTAAQLRRLSELTGDSQSSMVADLLSNASRVFDRTIAVLEAANLAKQELRTKAADDLQEAQGRIEAQLGIAFDEFDTYTGNLLEQVESVRRRAAKGAAGARSTPISNRGVRSTTKTRKTSTPTTTYGTKKVK